MTDDIKIRVAIEFDEMVKKIAMIKIKNGTADINDRESYSRRRITLALTRHPLIKSIVEDISLAQWEKNEISV